MDTRSFDPDRDAVMSYIGLRRSIGAIGFLLPVVLGVYALTQGHLQGSISSYYHTDMRDVFVGSMCAVGVFLLSYQFGAFDYWLGNVAGVAAILLALFPTTADTGTPTEFQRFAGVAHLASAVVFFLCLAAFSLISFPKVEPGKERTERKATRNHIYVTCGVVILLCLGFAVFAGTVLGEEAKADLRPLFWCEAVAIFAFGISWLIKGNTLFRDRVPATQVVGQAAPAV